MKNLKRIALVAMVMVLGAGAALASPFRFGVKAGINVNQLHFNSVMANFDSSNRCGFTAGVMTEFQVPIIGLCLDASLMYSRMNAEVTESSTTGFGVSSSAKNFFNIPVNLKYKLTLPVISSYLKPYIYTGPDFAFKLGGSDDVFKTKTFQCAWNVGVGIELINHLQIQGSYGFGMNNVFEKMTTVTTTDDFKTRNNYWTLTAAWLF